MGIAGAEARAVLLVKAKEIVAVDPGSGVALGARFSDARTPWPFFRGEWIWRSGKTGYAIQDLTGTVKSTRSAPKIPSAKPIPLGSTPDSYHGAHAGDRAVIAVDLGGVTHVIAYSLLDGRELWRVAPKLGGALRGLWALDTHTIALADDRGGRESFVCLDASGADLGRVTVPKHAGVRDAFAWGDRLIVAEEAGGAWVVLDATRASSRPLGIPSPEVRVRVVAGHAYALFGQTLQRIEPDGDAGPRVEVFEEDDYPHAYFAPVFALGDRLGLVRSTARDTSQIHWLDRSSLRRSGVSEPFPLKYNPTAALAAGPRLVLADGRNASGIAL